MGHPGCVGRFEGWLVWVPFIPLMRDGAAHEWGTRLRISGAPGCAWMGHPSTKVTPQALSGTALLKDPRQKIPQSVPNRSPLMRIAGQVRLVVLHAPLIKHFLHQGFRLDQRFVGSVGKINKLEI